MATLNEIAYDLAYHLDVSDNLEQINRLKYNIRVFRSMLIRQDTANHHTSSQFVQTIGCVELESVDAGLCCNICTGLTFMKSKKPIPSTVNRYTTNPYMSVTDLKYKNQYSYVDAAILDLKLKTQKFGNTPKYYFTENNYIFITTTAKYLKIIDIFENPEDLSNFKCGVNSDSLCYDDKENYPVSGDIAARLSMAILQGKFRLQNPPETTEVTLNK